MARRPRQPLRVVVQFVDDGPASDHSRERLARRLLGYAARHRSETPDDPDQFVQPSSTDATAAASSTERHPD